MVCMLLGWLQPLAQSHRHVSLYALISYRIVLQQHVFTADRKEVGPINDDWHGCREGGQGDMSPSEIVTLKFFFKQHGICDSQSNFQHNLGFHGGFATDPTLGSVPVWIHTVQLVTEPSFVSSETNCWLRPWWVMTHSLTLVFKDT